MWQIDAGLTSDRMMPQIPGQKRLPSATSFRLSMANQELVRS